MSHKRRYYSKIWDEGNIEKTGKNKIQHIDFLKRNLILSIWKIKWKMKRYGNICALPYKELQKIEFEPNYHNEWEELKSLTFKIHTYLVSY